MKKIVSGLIIILLISSTPVCAGNLKGVVTVLRKNSTRPLKSFENAVVYIKGIKAPTSPPTETLYFDQVNKKFIPRLLVAQVGQSIMFTNNDKVKHNVFSKDLNFDLGYMDKGGVVTRSFKDPGFYKIYCNIHSSMIADILVVDSPYYSLTDKKGKFFIPGVPEGEYFLVARHIYGGVTVQPIKVESRNDPIEVTIESAQVVREIKNHLDKHGNKYRVDDYDDY